MNTLMYFGVKNNRLCSSTAAELNRPWVLGGSNNPVSTIKFI